MAQGRLSGTGGNIIFGPAFPLMSRYFFDFHHEGSRLDTEGEELPNNEAAWPVGHRQPRADQVPSEKSPMDDSINRENAQLDRMTKGICRGC